MAKVKIVNADVIEWAKNYKGPKFHALFADVPYEISFMNKSWDSSGIAFNPDTWRALAEHLLPGAFLFVFAGTLNDDLISVAMRQAGLRKFHKSVLYWGNGAGFPKASRIDTAIDRAAGAKREIGGIRSYAREGTTPVTRKATSIMGNGKGFNVGQDSNIFTLPETPLAKAWAGHRYGLQAIKPAVETILIFHKPYDGKPIDSIVENGSGALWVDGARISTQENLNGGGYSGGQHKGNSLGFTGKDGRNEASKRLNPEDFLQPSGRWPANLLLQHSPNDNGTCSPECPCRELDEQSGKTGNGKYSGIVSRPRMKSWHGKDGRKTVSAIESKANSPDNYGDTGGASRFFFNADWNYESAEKVEQAAAVRYCAKASRKERNKNVVGFYWRKNQKSPIGFDRITHAEWEKLSEEDRAEGNIHPTVKTVSLCKYLATLLLPPVEYTPRRIVIPFSGSGSEAMSAALAGWEEIIAIEKEKEYCNIAKARTSNIDEIKKEVQRMDRVKRKKVSDKIYKPLVESVELFPELA